MHLTRIFASALLLVACGGDVDTSPDSGSDAGPSGLPDTGPPPVVDAGPQAEYYGPCDRETVCPGGGNARCFLPEEGWPGGMCSVLCDPAAPDCPGAGRCIAFGAAPDMGFCDLGCSTTADCPRPLQQCESLWPAGRTCREFCGDDADCEPTAQCDTERGFCVPRGPITRRGAGLNEPCTQGSDCNSGFCIQESLNPRFVGGACMRPCYPTGRAERSNCGEGFSCWPVNGGTQGYCMRDCESSDDCRPAFLCAGDDVGSLCIPGCTDARPCPDGYTCNDGACAPEAP